MSSRLAHFVQGAACFPTALFSTRVPPRVFLLFAIIAEFLLGFLPSGATGRQEFLPGFLPSGASALEIETSSYRGPPYRWRPAMFCSYRVPTSVVVPGLPYLRRLWEVERESISSGPVNGIWKERLLEDGSVDEKKSYSYAHDPAQKDKRFVR